MKGLSVGRTFGWLTAFAGAMGVLEAIVVVYLRELYYPSGFGFPLVPIPGKILFNEILREVTTIVMLLSVAFVSARGFYARLANFLFIFGVWDIFYYLGLEFLLGWPPSPLTWDVLFLIPIAWLAPVLAPALCALYMVALGVLVSMREEYIRKAGFDPWAWRLLASGSAVILYTFLKEHALLIIRNGFLRDYFSLPDNPAFIRAVSAHVPSGYDWPVFAAGYAMFLVAFFVILQRNVVTVSRV